MAELTRVLQGGRQKLIIDHNSLWGPNLPLPSHLFKSNMEVIDFTYSPHQLIRLSLGKTCRDDAMMGFPRFRKGTSSLF